MSDFGDWIDHQVSNAQNYLNTGLPTFGQVGDKINETAGRIKDLQGSIYDGIARGGTELYNEVTGVNRRRQEDWSNTVKADAEAARLKEIADRTLAAQNADVAASSAAQASRTPKIGNGGGYTSWRDPSGPDVTDYLGL